MATPVPSPNSTPLGFLVGGPASLPPSPVLFGSGSNGVVSVDVNGVATLDLSADGVADVRKAANQFPALVFVQGAWFRSAYFPSARSVELHPSPPAGSGLAWTLYTFAVGSYVAPADLDGAARGVFDANGSKLSPATLLLSVPAWASTASFAAGQVVSVGGVTLQATTSGTSGGSPPTPAPAWATVVDGSVVWQTVPAMNWAPSQQPTWGEAFGRSTWTLSALAAADAAGIVLDAASRSTFTETYRLGPASRSLDEAKARGL